MNKKNAIKNNKGQVMMIVIMALSGIMIGAMAISGTLTARQIRQSADAGSFSKALFAADAGLEWRLYKFIKDDYECNDECPDGEGEGNVCNQFPEFKELDNGIEVTLKTTCEDSTGSNPDSRDYYKIFSTGRFQKSSYTFSKYFSIPKL